MSKRCLGCMEMFDDGFDVCPHCGYVVGTPAEEAVHMEPGSILRDRYFIGKVLGFGGFGVTYLGWDGKLEQKVAIKEYLPGEFSTRMPGQTLVTVFNGDKSEQFSDGLKKFVEEAKRLAKFQNESGIVKIFDAFEENNTAYIVMEYLEGETLTDYLKREKTIPEDKAVEMLIPIMESLKVVHAAGLLHRDIAPDNIFLTNDGDVKLIDFGASRFATTSHSRSLTVIIKPGYSPEEQYRSRGDQGPYTDVYALGATLYKMITGKTPPDAMERRGKYEAESKDILVEPHKLVNKLSINREIAILNAMNVRIEDRTPDVETFINELNANPPAKRRYGKIKKINLYMWPLWLKILVPSVLAVLITFGALMLTGVINFSKYSSEAVIPENIIISPDVEGMYMDEAIDFIKDNKLVASLDGNVNSEYIIAGKIVIQTPVGGAFLERNGTVLLKVSAGNGVEEPVDGVATVPYLIGDKKDNALKKLKKAGLGTPTLEEVFDENIAEGLVVKSSMKSGEKVDVGKVLTLSISKGPKPIKMPDVVGKQIEEAKKALEKEGFIVKIDYKASKTVAENSVISQSVAKGKEVKRGSEITLTVATVEKLVKVTKVVGKKKSEAEKLLKKQGFKVSCVENYDDKVASGLVIKQTPGAGTSQKQGSTIALIISKGKKPDTSNSGSDDNYSDNSGQSNSSGSSSKSGSNSNSKSGSKSGSNSNKSSGSKSNKKTYTVYFDANGGYVYPMATTVTNGSKYGYLPTPYRNYDTFTGWYTARSGGSKISSGSTVSLSSNQTLYAHWKSSGGSGSGGGYSYESGWVVSSQVPAGAKIIETKWTYKVVSYTTSTNSYMPGWELYDTTVTYGNYGNWSAWSTTQYYASDTRMVDSRYVADSGSGSGSDQGDNPWGGYGYGGYGQGGGYGGGTGGHYEWRYADRQKYTTYKFRKTEQKESYSDPSGQQGVSDVVKWVRYKI